MSEDSPPRKSIQPGKNKNMCDKANCYKMKEKILQIISQIETEKKDKIEPCHAMMDEILNRVDDKITGKNALRQLVKEGKVKCGETINSYYFKTIKL